MEPNLILIFILAANIGQLVSEESYWENYRLPNIYNVLNYRVDLTLYPDLFTSAGTEFSGRVDILFLFKHATNYIALHSEHDVIKLNKITFDSVEIPSGNYNVNNETNILTINIGNKASTNKKYLLVIKYTATVNTKSLVGLYKSSYVNRNGITKYLLTTQLSSTYARRVFPCFDEPGYKAFFNFNVSFPAGLNVFFNTREINRVPNNATGMTTVTFERTPYMSTYILALVVSDLTCTSSQADTIPLRVCSRDEVALQRRLALDTTPKLLTKLNEFTEYNYSRAIGKLDLVAVPDFRSGAMENWGLVIFRESELLYDNAESSNAFKEEILIVIAHELAHQWFGNLVTFRWWSEVFLNEGLASYFQYYLLDQVMPDYELEKRIVLDCVHPVLVDDGRGGVAPLHSEDIETRADIDGTFNKGSYLKGGSLIRMVQHFLSMRIFRLGIRNYVSMHRYRNVDSEDLWFALYQTSIDEISRLPANITVIMNNWIREFGYPLVNVTLNGDRIKLSQARFSYFGLDKNVKWYIPISYTTSDESNKFKSTTPHVWLTPKEDMHSDYLPNWDWIILNNQQIGYYRVNYDSVLWMKIKAALQKENFDGIIDLNRAQIVDDLFSLARADILDYSFALSTISFLKNDTSYYPWKACLEGYEILLRRVGDHSALGKAIGSEILNLIDKFYNTVPISDIKKHDHFYSLKQLLAVKWACRLGHQDCINEAVKLFKSYGYSGRRPPKDLRSIIYCYGLKYSESEDDWHSMWRAYLKAEDQPSEQEIIRTALGCSRNITLLKKYLHMSITEGSGIRSQDSLTIFTAVGGNPLGVDVAFNFLIENQERIVEQYGFRDAVEIAFLGISSRLTSPEQITKLRNLVRSRSLAEGFLEYGERALSAAEGTEYWLDKYASGLENYYYNNNDTSYNLYYLIFLVPTFIILAYIYIYYTSNNVRRLTREENEESAEDVPMQELQLSQESVMYIPMQEQQQDQSPPVYITMQEEQLYQHSAVDTPTMQQPVVDIPIQDRQSEQETAVDILMQQRQLHQQTTIDTPPQDQQLDHQPAMDIPIQERQSEQETAADILMKLLKLDQQTTMDTPTLGQQLDQQHAVDISMEGRQQNQQPAMDTQTKDQQLDQQPVVNIPTQERQLDQEPAMDISMQEKQIDQQPAMDQQLVVDIPIQERQLDQGL